MESKKKDRRKDSSRLKQKIVVKNLVENGGSIGKAVRDAGYSEAYATSGKITKTKTWAELMEEFLPDDTLAKTHQEALEAKKIVVAGGVALETGLADHDIRMKALEMAYKLKGLFAADKIQIMPGSDLSDEDLDKEIERTKNQLGLDKKE